MEWLRRLVARWLGYDDRPVLSQLGEGLGALLNQLRAKELSDAIAYDVAQWEGGAGPFWFDPQRYAGTYKDWLVVELPVRVANPGHSCQQGLANRGLQGGSWDMLRNVYNPPPMPSSQRRFDVDRARVSSINICWRCGHKASLVASRFNMCASCAAEVEYRYDD